MLTFSFLKDETFCKKTYKVTYKSADILLVKSYRYGHKT